jgi:hypothetical protein
MPISNYNTGFPNGVTIRNAPILDLQNGNGNVFWVDSNTGSDSNVGTFTFPLASLAKALELVKDDQGDKILLAAGHLEEMTSDTTHIVSKSGIQIIGLGTSDNRAHLRASGTAAASLNITGTNVYIGNVLFTTNYSVITNLLYVNGDGFVVENCRFGDRGHTPDIYINLASDNSKIINCEIETRSGSATAGIAFHNPCRNILIEECIVVGEFTAGCVQCPAGIGTPGIKNLSIHGGEYENYSTTGYPFDMETSHSSYGIISRDTTVRSNTAEGLDIYAVSDFDIGKHEKGDVLSFSAIIPIAKVVGSTAYLFTVHQGGFHLEDLIIETDGTGLGGSTNLIVEETQETYGPPQFFIETIANLGSNSAVALEDASVAGYKREFTKGTRVFFDKTGAALTGNNFEATFVLRALKDGSSIVKNASF